VTDSGGPREPLPEHSDAPDAPDDVLSRDAAVVEEAEPPGGPFRAHHRRAPGPHPRHERFVSRDPGEGAVRRASAAGRGAAKACRASPAGRGAVKARRALSSHAGSVVKRRSAANRAPEGAR